MKAETGRKKKPSHLMCLKRKTCLESLRRVQQERGGGGEEVAEALR